MPFCRPTDSFGHQVAILVGCLGEIPAGESCRLPLGSCHLHVTLNSQDHQEVEKDVAPSSSQVDVDAVRGHLQVDQKEDQDVAGHRLVGLDVDHVEPVEDLKGQAVELEDLDGGLKDQDV